VVWLANTLGRLGIALKAGEVILSGSLAAMVPVAAGDSLRISLGGIGSAGVKFVYARSNMKLEQKTIVQLAEYLETAELENKAVTKITDRYPDMDWDDAYAIQSEIRRRNEARGTKIVGLKMGLTSHANRWA
jgi:2-keto-4-pentenoate hydratase